MKKLKNLMLVTLIGMSVLGTLSCNNEELYEEPVAIVEDESNEDEGLNVANVDEPCDFNLDDIDQNSTVIINCVLDLQGETFNLPENVTLIEEGGEIINGTLNFSEGSSIDGDLLGNTLTVSGVNPALRSTSFNFDIERWGIVEGVVSDEIALRNKEILQSTIDLVKKYGIDTFIIDKMDAYFHFEYGWFDSKGYAEMAINLPSDFHLKMSDNTYFRLQPNNWPKGRLMSVYEKENVKISGGNFYGDRYTHDYSDIFDELNISRGTHEWPGLIIVDGSKNVLVDNVYCTESTGDAFIVGASNGFRYQNTSYNQNIKITNSTFTESRRNNITVTDGEDIYIENCLISGAGNGDDIFDSSNNKIFSSAGVAPRVGIDIEPIRGWNETDGFTYYEKVERVYVKGCTFVNNNRASFVDYSGVDVTVENCISDNGFSSAYSTGGKYLNNTLIASDLNKNGTGITMGSMDVTINGEATQLSEKNIVKGNSIEGFVIGTVVRSNNSEVSNNSYLNCWVGLKILKTENTIFDGNDFKSSRTSDSRAISFFEGVAKNLTLSNMTVEMPRKPLDLIGINKNNTDYYLNFVNCKFTSEQGYSIEIKDTPNVTFTNTTLTNTKFDVTNSINFITK
ncbi:right-handed parallel beta-helix repeat-containing protein [Algibacter sp. L4_22]|uniref:right-handed parallel beta-helix repeat-containing protein n=1 Tax=Algibacter sp. L4_22 TaxID=2942477 RepID=UPI00201B8A8C|nr:right-handed parallel beta-helix repeat-containing protein [Algibacter sp. L4_22]MCL5127861.1 right-handed parallel beta-helix repeat-containing protein [Algibacter sp. L4_22]